MSRASFNSQSPWAFLQENPESSIPDALMRDLAASRRAQNPSMEDRAAVARSQGYTVRGDRATYARPGTGAPTGRNLSTFNLPGGQLPALPTQALLEDTARMQGAADRQWGRNQAEIEGMRGFLDEAPGQIIDEAARGAAQLEGVAGEARDLGRQQEGDFTAFRDNVMANADRGADRANADIDQAYELGDEAVSEYQRSISRYEDRGAQDASAVASAMNRRAASSMRMARSGMHPDGTPMTPAEQADAIAQVQFDTQAQIQEAVTPMLSHYNDAIAGLEQNLASLRMGNAGNRLQGASLRTQAESFRADIGSQMGAQTLQAQANRQRMQELYSNLHQAGTQLRSAAILSATDLEMQGRMGMAQLVQQNPESVVGWFQGLMSLLSANAAMTGNTRAGRQMQPSPRGNA
jgi:hypothetical protein